MRGYHRSLCVETDVGPLHHFQWRGGANNSVSGMLVCSSFLISVCMFIVSVFNVMWSELLIKSTISFPLWSSVYECQRVECAFTSPVRTECGMFMIYCMQCCMSMSTVI